MTTIRSIIVTHQGRLRCLLHDYLMQNSFERKTTTSSNVSGVTDTEYDSDSDMNINSVGGGKDKVHRFQNACVVKMSVNQMSVKIEMLANGTIDEEKPDYIYYVKPGTKDSKAEQGKYKIQEFHPKTLLNNNKLFNLTGDNNNYEFYLIRHGQAEHNVLKGVGKAFSKKNTSLTPEGRKQAQVSGREVKNLLNNVNVDFLFVSDLKRTTQTLKEFANVMNPSLLSKTAIVLPCNHELKYNNSSNCDGKQNITPNENITTCKPTTNGVDSCKVVENVKLEWKHYIDFYDGVRSSTIVSKVSGLSGKKRKHCRENNVIDNALSIIKLTPESKRKIRPLKEILNEQRANNQYSQQYVPINQMKRNVDKTRKLASASEKMQGQASEFAQASKQLLEQQKKKRFGIFGGKTRRKTKGNKRNKQTKKRKWSLKYKKSINCKRPKGFSQKQHCKYGRKKTRKTRKVRK